MNAPSILLARRSASLCLSCRRQLLRQFSASAAPFLAFQPYPLNSQPSPSASAPRNASVPDTSIAHSVLQQQQQPLPKVHETRPPKPLSGGAPPSPPRLPEQQAQQSRQDFASAPATNPSSNQAASSSSPAVGAPAAESSPTTATAQTQTETQTQTRPQPPSQAQAQTQTPAPAPTPAAPKPRSRLRTPRKAAMKLTPAAVAHLRSLLDQPSPKLIKVGVRNRGCSGLAYHLEFVERPGAFDETVEQDGVRVLIDSKALFSIIGSEMDWVEDKLNQRFVFRNPNIKEQCGCGESFMV